MKWYWIPLRIVVALVIALHWQLGILFIETPPPIYAASTTADVVVTYSMNTTEIYAPTNFTITDLGGYTGTANWTKGVNSTYTHIIVNRTNYPESITDGEELYYGTGTSVNFTGWAFDTQTVYASAWGVSSDNVTYSSTYATAQEGGRNLILAGIFILAGIVSYLSIRNRDNILIALGASISWIFLFAYTRDNPVPGVTNGSNVDNMLILAIWAVALALPIIAIRNMRNNRSLRDRGYVIGEDGGAIKDRDITPRPATMMDANLEEYRATIRGRMRRRKR